MLRVMRSKRGYQARRTNEFLALAVFLVFIPQVSETQPFLLFLAEPAKHSVSLFTKLAT